MRSGRLDRVHPPEAPLDILAQQLVAEVAACGACHQDHLFDLVRRAGVTRGGIAGVLLTHAHADHNGGCGMLGVEIVVGNEEGFAALAAMLVLDRRSRLGAAAAPGVRP